MLLCLFASLGNHPLCPGQTVDADAQPAVLLCLSASLSPGDPSALLRETVENGLDGAPYAGLASAASRGRSAAAPPVQAASAAKVNLAEVRLQLQRQLKQQVRRRLALGRLLVRRHGENAYHRVATLLDLFVQGRVC